MNVLKPLVSVIIPAYNSRAFIRRAVDSVLIQDYPSVEILVVDDGSEDDTAGALASLGDRVRCVRQDHAGAAAARNRGVRESRGEFVAFLDSDDEWLPGRLSKCLQPMVDNENIGMTFCHTLEKKTDGRMAAPNASYEENRVFPQVLWPDSRQCTPATSCRRSVVERVGGFDETLEAWEDQDLWIRMEEAAEAAEVEEALVTVHNREQSVSARLGLETVRRDHLRVIERALDRRPDFYEPHRKIIMADHYLNWGIRYYSAGENGRAREFLGRSLRYLPTLRCASFFIRTWLPRGLLAVLRGGRE